MKFRFVTLFVLLLNFNWAVFAQLNSSQIIFFNKQQDTLLKIARKMYKLKNDSLKLALNKEFTDKWEEVLNNELSMQFNFDSLRSDVGILRCDDERFRIINWDIPLKGGTHQYFGFLQARHPKTKKYELYDLNDISENIKNPETHTGDNSKWFGMLYYQIVICKDYYLLLGFDRQDKILNRKIIEPLSFKSDGSPVFGKGVFNNIPKKFPKRIVFEYSAEARVNVSYYPEEKKIIFNHVGPPSGYLEDQTQLYVPDGSYDCFEYKKGNWYYREDCDARNPKSRLDNAKPPKNKEKPVYVPK